MSFPQQTGLVGYKNPPVSTRFGAPNGNPTNAGGRPKNRASITVAYDKLMMLNPAEILAFEPTNGAEAAAKVQAVNAISGKPLEALPSTKEITDRTEGKAPQKMTIEAIPASDEAIFDAMVNQVVAKVRALNPDADPALIEEIARERVTLLQAESGSGG